ncbi:MAG: group III truncated hemoglobin [Bradyrhizobium sp.]|nr:group III truncated hemoglobin [Bradyrhizobium sp.]
MGIDEELIRAVVEAFYARVRTDADLGPIFQRILDWPAHLARMCDFWSSVILITGAYKGDVIGQHLPLPGLTERHFGKWIELFEATTKELCTPQQAAVFSTRAAKIAEVIKAARRRSAQA